ncbi:MAG: hypothetical protein J6Y11_06725 [Paludibacteraceae bacterium]|nr:hypothetical protein [Paludibacteraceae bacterium]
MKKHFLFLAMPLVAALSFASCDKDEKEESSNGDENQNSSNQEYVDLGLPSGTLWATCNVGATKPEEYGDYFAWGETETKEVYEDSTYKFISSIIQDGISYKYFTKYNGSEATDEQKTEILLPEDDAATVNLGKEWRTPTWEEFYELLHNCCMIETNDYKGTSVHGLIFYKVKDESHKGTGVRLDAENFVIINTLANTLEYLLHSYSEKSDTHIFLPAAGGIASEGTVDLSNQLVYWSSTLYGSVSHAPRILEGFGGNGCDRTCGLPVRPIRVK